MQLYAHLNFGGNCEEAFHSYEKHLGGRITMMMNQSQAPGAPSGVGSFTNGPGREWLTDT